MNPGSLLSEATALVTEDILRLLLRSLVDLRIQTFGVRINCSLLTQIAFPECLKLLKKFTVMEHKYQVGKAKIYLFITLLFQLWVLLRQQEQRGHRETLQQL